MHKNIPVAKLEIDDSGILIKVFEIYNTDHLLYSIPKKCLDQIEDSLQDWLINRSIPNLRLQLSEILSMLNLKTQFYFIKKSMGLSLSDQ